MEANAPTGAMAPELSVDRWFNSEERTLSGLRGKVVALHAFQILCPGCVAHGIPQAQRMQGLSADLVVLGMHSVFEHHLAMEPVALRAFLHEYRVTFPVAVDRREPGSDVPLTMQAYGMKGTPTLVLIDRFGRIAYHAFGRAPDVEVGIMVGRLLEGAVDAGSDHRAVRPRAAAGGCDADGCQP